MHELTIANTIISEAKKQGKVKAITIEVGDLAHLPAEDLEKALKGLVNWKITVLKKTAIIECECGYKGEPHILERLHDSTIFECPKCKATPKIIEGDQIKLKEVEIEQS